ncbi:MAG: hypothetical protein ACRDY2_03050 [Acidimicrobiales bacterium]
MSAAGAGGAQAPGVQLHADGVPEACDRLISFLLWLVSADGQGRRVTGSATKPGHGGGH